MAKEAVATAKTSRSESGGTEPSAAHIEAFARARQRIALVLAVLVAASGVGFTLVTGFWPQAMRVQLVPGFSWLMLFFVAVILFALILVGIYVYWAAHYYDSDWMLRPGERR